MSSARFLTALAIALATLPAAVAEAGFAPAGETVFEAEQTSAPDVAIDAAGDAIVVWSQEQKLGDPQEALARRVAAGGAVGPALGIAPGEIASQPAVAATATGRAFLAWQARTEEPGPASVKGRWLEPDGTLGPILTLVAGKAGEVVALDVDVVIDPAGVASVTWKNEVTNRLSLRRVQPDGTLGVLLPDISGGSVVEPVSAALANGSTLVAWRGSGVEMNVVDAALGIGVPLKISATGTAGNPSLAVDSLGNAVISWRAGLGELWGAFARRVGPTGALVGGELTLDPLAAEFVNRATVAADSAGEFVVVWERQNGKNEVAVRSRPVSAEAGIAGAVQTVTEASELTTPGAVPALFESGIGAVAWRGGTEGAHTVLGRQIGAAGEPTAAAQQLLGKSSLNSIVVASAPAIGAAAFVVHYPISGSAQGAVVQRFLAPPSCAAGSVAFAGKPVAVPLTCGGAGIEGLQVLSPPAHGRLSTPSLAPLSFTYTPRRGWTGGDRFTYAASNDGGTSASTVVRLLDRAKPRIKVLKVIKRFSKSRPPRVSYRFRLAFSEPATAKLTVKRLTRVGGKPKLRKLGTVRSKRAALRATVPLTGRLARQLLAGGRFRVLAVATDAAGKKSAAKKRAFRAG